MLCPIISSDHTNRIWLHFYEKKTEFFDSFSKTIDIVPNRNEAFFRILYWVIFQFYPPPQLPTDHGMPLSGDLSKAILFDGTHYREVTLYVKTAYVSGFSYVRKTSR